MCLVAPCSPDPAGANWNEMDNVRDLTMNLETGESDVTTRANSGWRQTAATLKDGSLEFEMIWDATDAGFTKIQTAWAAGTEVALMALDGGKAVSGSQGLAGNFVVTNFSRGEPLEEAITVSVTVKPSSYTEWVTAA